MKNRCKFIKIEKYVSISQISTSKNKAGLKKLKNEYECTKIKK